MFFKIVSNITEIERIAAGRAIRAVRRLRKQYGGRRWRKLKGKATVELVDGTICVAELHWYEAHGVGAREYKIKRVLELL